MTYREIGLEHKRIEELTQDDFDEIMENLVKWKTINKLMAILRIDEQEPIMVNSYADLMEKL